MLGTTTKDKITSTESLQNEDKGNKQCKVLQYKNKAAPIPEVTNHDFRVSKCHPFFFAMT